MGGTNLKKIICIVLALLMFTGVAACAQGSYNEAQNVVRPEWDTDDYRMNEMTDMVTALSWNADWYPAGTDAQNNPVYDLYKSAVNINMINKFALTWDGYEQQITSGLITGDLPDVFFASNKMLDELIRNDLIVDLKPYYDQWATQELKDTLEYNDGINFTYAIRDGKMYGIPKVTDDCDRATVWARADWIANLNARDNSGKKIFDTENGLRFHATGPKSLEEYWAMAEAFALEDPDGNGKKDTYGISIGKGLDKTSLPIYNAYGAYPTSFVENEDGTWSCLGLSENMKKVLEKLADCVARGIIDSDYINWTPEDAWSKAAAGQAGLVCGPAYLPTWPLENTLAYDGDWTASPMYSEDGSDFVQSRQLNVTGYYVVTKKYEHPEALIKILNNLATSDEDNLWYKGYMEASEPVENSSIFNWMPISIDRSTVNFERYDAFMYAIDAYESTGEFDTSQIEARDMPSFNKVKNYYLYGMDYQTGWAMYKTYMEGIPVALSYEEEGIYNEWLYPDTATMKARGTSLDKMTSETRAMIIAGTLPVSAFDDYVDDWLAGGGSKILKEMQDYKQSLGE